MLKQNEDDECQLVIKFSVRQWTGKIYKEY